MAASSVAPCRTIVPPVSNPDLWERPIGGRDEYVCPTGCLTVLTRAASADVLRPPPVASWVRVQSETGTHTNGFLPIQRNYI